MAREAVPRTALLAAMLALAASACTTLPRLPQGLRGLDLLDSGIEVAFDRPSDLRPPERMRVTSTAGRAISLAWDPVLVEDVAGYVVTRASRAEGPYEIIGRTRSRFATRYTDRGDEPGSLGDGRTYHYRLHPYDSQGRGSRSHAYLVATTDPAPATPEGLRAYSNLPRRVVLEWEPSDDPSVESYALHRSPTVAGPWEQVAVVEGRLQTIHEDPVPGDLRVMYYRVRARNAFGGTSEMTEPVRAVTKAEPLPPTGVELAARSLGQVKLRWIPNVEDDLNDYEVWRAEQSRNGWSREHRIARVEPMATDLLDTAIGCRQVVRYRLRATDRDGLVSGFSRPFEVEAEGVALSVSPGEDGGLRLHWDPARARGWEADRVLERRRILPDRVLARPAGEHELLLPALGEGRHRLALVLTRAGDTAPEPAAATREAPDTLACELPVEVPASVAAPPAPT